LGGWTLAPRRNLKEIVKLKKKKKKIANLNEKRTMINQFGVQKTPEEHQNSLRRPPTVSFFQSEERLAGIFFLSFFFFFFFFFF